MGVCVSRPVDTPSIILPPQERAGDDPYDDGNERELSAQIEIEHTPLTRYTRESDDDTALPKNRSRYIEPQETLSVTQQPHSAVTEICSRADPLTANRYGVSVGGMICLSCGNSFTKRLNHDGACLASDLPNQRHRAEPPANQSLKCVFCAERYVPLAVCTRAKFHHAALSTETVRAVTVLVDIDYPKVVAATLFERACDLGAAVVEYFTAEHKFLSATGISDATVNRTLWRHATRAAVVVQQRQLFLPLPPLPSDVLSVGAPPMGLVPVGLLHLPTRLNRIPVLPHVCVEERDRTAAGPAGRTTTAFHVGPWAIERDELRYIVSHVQTDSVVYHHIELGDDVSASRSFVSAGTRGLRVGRDGKALRRAASLRAELASANGNKKGGAVPGHGGAAAMGGPAALDGPALVASALQTMYAVEAHSYSAHLEASQGGVAGRRAASPWASSQRAQSRSAAARNTTRDAGDAAEVVSVEGSDDDDAYGDIATKPRTLHEVVALDLSGVSWWRTSRRAVDLESVCEWAVLRRTPVAGSIGFGTSSSYRAELVPVPPTAVVPLWLTVEERVFTIAEQVLAAAWYQSQLAKA